MKALADNNIELYERKVSALSCTQAIETGIQISQLKREDLGLLKVGVHAMILNVLNHLNSVEKFPSHLIENLIGQILGRYWWLKFEELAYIFNQGKNGHYGKQFGSPSPKMFIDWIHEYDINERELSRIGANRKLQKESNESIVLSDDQLKEFYKNNVGIDNTKRAPDGSERSHEREKPFDKESYQKEKEKYLSDPEAKQRNEELLKKLNQK